MLFLKTLEEPPAHVKFVLATTELHKVIDTVKSRCQQVVFQSPSIEVLSGVIDSVSKKEGYAVDSDAVGLIAQLGDGSFRDTLGMLQKVLFSIEGKKVARADVEKYGGAPREELVLGYVKALLSGEKESGLEALNAVLEAQYDVKLFAQMVMQQVRLVMFARYAPKLYEQYAKALSSDMKEVISEMAGDKGLGNLSLVLSRLLDAYVKIPGAYIKTMPLELLLISER